MLLDGAGQQEMKCRTSSKLIYLIPGCKTDLILTKGKRNKAVTSFAVEALPNLDEHLHKVCASLLKLIKHVTGARQGPRKYIFR